MKNLIVFLILAPFNLVFRLFKIKKNRVTFIALKDNKLAKDFALIAKELEKDNEVEKVYLLSDYNKGVLGNFYYFIELIKQSYYVNTSAVVLLDYNNYVVSKFKKKGVKVIQLWHANGAIKKFGNDIKREYKINNYDYVIANSPIWKKYYSSAFNVKEDNVISLGIPRTDKLFSHKYMDKKKKEMVLKYPEIKDKKVVLYAPTFRGNPIHDKVVPKINLDLLKEYLGNEYVVMYKLHPCFEDVNITQNEEIINVHAESLSSLYSITDYFISDYSAVIFDFSIMLKPMLFYVPDLEKYKAERGVYQDYEEMIPGPICRNEGELTHYIKYDLRRAQAVEKIKEFKDKYFVNQDGKSTERVVDFIKSLID